MPTVPVAPENQLRAFPSVRANPARDRVGALGAQVTDRLSDLSAFVAVKQQNQRNADLVMRAEGDVKKAYLEYERTARERRGQNAYGVADDTAKWWKDIAPKMLDGLENDVQRRALAQTLEQLQLQSLDSFSRYESVERQRSLEEAAQASISGSIDLAAANHDNPEAVSGARRDVRERLDLLGRQQGWTPEVREAHEREHLTNLHKGVLRAKIDKDPQGAQEYYAANKEEIAGTERDEIEKILRLGNLRARAQVATDSIMAQGVSRTRALAMAREKFSGEEEDEVVQRINARFAEAEQAKNESERHIEEAGWNSFADNDMDITKIPTTLWSALPGKVRLAMKKQAEAERSGTTVHTDWDTYDELMGRWRQDPKAFASMDLRPYNASLSVADRRSFVKLQNDARDPEANLTQVTLDQQISEMWGKVNLNDSGEKAKNGRNQFTQVARAELNAEELRIGKKLNYAERQKLLDRLAIEGRVAGGGFLGVFGKTKRLYEVINTSEESEFEVTVPDEERELIEEALHRRGRPVDDETVLALYKRRHGLQ